MTCLERFLSPQHTSLKVCGITCAADARHLVDLRVEALGVNFWPRSKRYLDPAQADWLREFKDQLLRVGVFVNADPADAMQWVRDGLIDVVQLHGDEQPRDVQPYLDARIPFIKAVGVSSAAAARAAADYRARAVLLDAHAPGDYGGTGATFDWNDALSFRASHPEIPLLLAGGIHPGNALQACRYVRPAAIDVASGAETSPGVKDVEKVRALCAAVAAANAGH